MGLAQVFTTSGPLGGVSAVTVSSVSLYFKSISSTMGIDIQLREVANGFPTYNVVKNSRITARPGEKYANGASILTTSGDGSTPSVFTFQKPVQLHSLSQYAIMVLPHASDPAYALWGATANSVDQASHVPVQLSAACGPLITWDPGADRTISTNKALKFMIQKGFAANTRFHDDSYNFNEEHIIVNEFTAPFSLGEYCFMSNSFFSFSSAQLFGTDGSFINGEQFYQNDGSGNTAIGTVFSANADVVLLKNIEGQVSNTLFIHGVSSGAIGYPTYLNSNIVCSSSSNTVTFPFIGNNSVSLFYANQSIYLTSSDLLTTQAFIVTSVTGNTIQLSWKPGFSDNQCSGGQLRGDNLALKMNYQGYDSIKQTNFVSNFNNSTANTQVNQNFHFGNSIGQYIIGQSSRARCKSFGTIDLEYHCVIPQMHFEQVEENKHVLYWGGYRSYKQFESNYPSVWRYITAT